MTEVSLARVPMGTMATAILAAEVPAKAVVEAQVPEKLALVVDGERKALPVLPQALFAALARLAAPQCPSDR